MRDICNYDSRVGDPRSRRYETLSYLPRLDDAAIRRQVEHIIARGWTPAIEHVEPQRAMVTYWYLWKLPLFGERDAETVLREAAACHEANPGNHVRLIGYDNKRQTQGTAMVVYRGSDTA